MPIHLYWGDDEAGRQRAVDALITAVVEPSWQSINLTRLDGNDGAQAAQALSEARTPPLGGGHRVVVLQRSPFCSACPADLAGPLEDSLGLIPEHTHLVLVSPGKPDARLRTTKSLRAVAEEQSFALPAVWDGSGQLDLVRRTAQGLGHALTPEALEALAEAIGSDSARLASELEKLALYCGQRPIDGAAVAALVGSQATTSLQLGDALLRGDLGEAIALLDHLVTAGEPPLRIVAALTSQIRGWLWVSLLEAQGEQDVAVIARAAGIGNPKRIYVMRKQIRGRPAKLFLALLGQLLDIEASLKLGAKPGDAFRDGLLAAAPR